MTTPMMAQWQDCKKSQPDAVLLFRLGDFYEAFHDDAKTLSKELDVTLTQRQGIPMSGVPFHAAESYIEKLVSKGYLVAIAEQTGDPKASKGLVKREIVRTISPATTLSQNLISDKAPNFFACLTQVNATLGLALLDHTTGEFITAEFENIEQLSDELFRREPKELLTSAKTIRDKQDLADELHQHFSTRVILQEDYIFDHQTAYDFLTRHFHTQTLDGFGLKGMCAAINAAGALLSHMADYRSLSIEHIQAIRPNFLTDFMAIDKATQRGLELIQPLYHSHQKHTLLHHLDQTCTAMGARLMRSWVIHPLLNPDQIKARQLASEELSNHLSIGQTLKTIRDLERLMTRISSGYGTPRDLQALCQSLDALPQIQALLDQMQAEHFGKIKLGNHRSMQELIATAIAEHPPLRISDGGTIKNGYNRDLDELREIKANSQNWLAQYQMRLREDLGIKNLKVAFNKAFGYSIEVSRGQADKMPETFHKRQTLINTERFISPELKEYEEKILTADEKILNLEAKLYEEIKTRVLEKRSDILKTAQNIARFDCLYALAVLSKKRGYTRPIVDSSDILHIEGGRHPIIEEALAAHTFISNDTYLDTKNRLFIITGPNMAGKSTYIRQVALITIMAQIGASVPADKAHIGITDKVFSRIGASDDLARGQSTFMVEMTETSNILHNATSRSLIILDEIGRGTSTYDGVAIAWAVAEYLLTTPSKRAKTLFATHYFELTDMENKIPGAINYNVA
ncbi:MAG TPA: DNA mismatch repair protein MutS, partial [Chlamydiales bacterium]|nr:DNA mismatch repair protein MutS [Chlamydiales bacterium]